MERIWRREGLKVPKKQPKRRRLWLGDGSCIRLRPLYRGHVWSYDFVEDRTHNGRKFRMLNIIDEFSRECLAMVPLRRLRSNDVIDVLAGHGRLDKACGRYSPLPSSRQSGSSRDRFLGANPISLLKISAHSDSGSLR